MFALQQWLSAHVWYPKIEIKIVEVIAAWELQYFLWGIFCLILWTWMGVRLQKASWFYIAFRMIPLSVVLSVLIEMALAGCFPQFPISKTPLSFWQRLDFGLTEELLSNMGIFWTAFFVLRALGNREDAKRKEVALSQVETKLVQAQLQTLRMQINPHFLFNTMNDISSLMHTDVSAADAMMEQLSNMLRVSFQLGSKELIPFCDELDFIENYLALQDRRFAGTIRQDVKIEPRLYDALVPAMILQPIVENAYVHGLSHLSAGGVLEIRATQSDHERLRISIRNNGVGLKNHDSSARAGIGINNIKDRLRLHFGTEQSVLISETSPNHVEVTITFPLRFQQEVSGDISAYSGRVDANPSITSR